MNSARIRLSASSLIVLGLLLLPLQGQAAQKPACVSKITQPESQAFEIRDPLDVINRLPFFSQFHIPRSFLFRGRTSVNLNGDNIVIDHRVNAIPSPQKYCLISLSYGGRWGGSLESQVDVPLFHAPSLGLHWKSVPFGDYTAKLWPLSRSSSTYSENSNRILLVTSARF